MVGRAATGMCRWKSSGHLGVEHDVSWVVGQWGLDEQRYLLTVVGSPSDLLSLSGNRLVDPGLECNNVIFRLRPPRS